ncbi:Guanine nucleotide-binding protein alpha-4 subunit [Mycena indigotica]|uniref:Guanine nucleotide-binding protein alpha-4 subunit n=1 Tax=Mycena indigotica TaxID=2126181 RepID=A0A8H6SC76_9AGAR|nr:Guanine nucleotide-binding protein alpha-4 subunit [Mycena indigotica]KAF7296871.1 Guanine nucleotide-binding protein alpha-4 subunit [Mycena indigotica]
MSRRLAHAPFPPTHKTTAMPARISHRSQLSDPLSAVIAPPVGESAAAKQARVAREAEEQRVSDAIDDELRRERQDRKKRGKREVKVLLLGQSESGKSTVLKNFRLKYAPAQWKAELQSWRAVVQLNLVQNVLTILDVLQERLSLPEATEVPTGSSPPSSFPTGSRTSFDSTISDITTAPPALSPAAAKVQLSQKHRILLLRLSPLRKVAEDLRRVLGAGADFSNADDAAHGYGVLDDTGPAQPKRKEFAVRGWISALGLKGEDENRPVPDSPTDSTSEVLSSLRDDILALWEDTDVRALLRAADVRIEDRAGFFLPDTARITAPGYVPSDNDVVRARLRTMGVQEWRVVLEQGAGGLGGSGLASDSFGAEWVIYDVGGSRSMRHAWLPYFDAVNAIIFLAPISCFDERLAEDPRVNRLEDTLLLWKAVVKSPLLRGCTLVVFLNKCDLLKRKLQSGIMVNRHMLSFGNRPNEVGVVVKYLKDKFKDILRADAASPALGGISAAARTTYLYATSVTDTKATAATLNIVRDGIIREHLKHAEFV